MQDAKRIADLAAKLQAIKRRGLARQIDIEAATGVDQTVISRLVNGHRKRMNTALHRLESYANMLLNENEVPVRVQQAAKEFLVFGTESELVASIELAQQLVARRLA